MQNTLEGALRKIILFRIMKNGSLIIKWQFDFINTFCIQLEQVKELTYLEYVRQVSEVEDVVEFDGSGEEGGCDLRVKS